MDNKWVQFYAPVIGHDTAINLVQRTQNGPPANRAKLILYQTRRLVSIADDIINIRPGREALQLLFLLICAEHVAKLAKGTGKEGKSRHYTKEFFRRFMSDADRDLLDTGFKDRNMMPMEWQTSIDALYDVRCDVVHEGAYWEFHFRQGDVSMLNLETQMIAEITLVDFRNIIIRCAARAVEAAIDWEESR